MLTVSACLTCAHQVPHWPHPSASPARHQFMELLLSMIGTMKSHVLKGDGGGCHDSVCALAKFSLAIQTRKMLAEKIRCGQLMVLIQEASAWLGILIIHCSRGFWENLPKYASVAPSQLSQPIQTLKALSLDLCSPGSMGTQHPST